MSYTPTDGYTQLTGGAISKALGLGSTVTAYGNLRVTTEPGNIFNDPFDGATIDTTDRWNAAALTGTFTVTQASGGLVITTNTTTTHSAYIDTKPVFAPLGLNFIAFGAAVKLEAQSSNLFVTNQHRFIGFANRPASFVIGTPLLDAIGFEIDTTGQLRCSVYSNGTRVYTTTTSLTGVNLNTLVTPSTGYCRFGMALRADTIVFYVNSTEYPVASFSVADAAFTLPNVQSLPFRMHAINAGSAPSGTSTFIISNLAVGDTGGNSQAISDGNFGFRKVTVKSGGYSVTSADNSMVVSDMDHELGIASAMTSNRDRQFAQRYSILADSLADGLATFWTSTVSGGTNTAATGEGLIQTGTGTTGAALLTSTTPAHLPGQVHFTTMSIRLGDTGAAGAIQRFGACTMSGTTPQDGYYFELNGTTFNAVSARAGTPTAVASTSWSRVSTAPFTLDANYHVYDIRWTSTRADFYIDGILRHTLSTGATPLTNTMNVPMVLQGIKTSGATNRVLAIRNASLGRFGTPGSGVSAAALTQDIKDTGRTHINLYAVAAASGATTVETAITLTKSAGTAATSTGTSFVVTAGKTFRITALSVATRGHATATIQTTTFNLRMNTAGAVGTTSTPVLLSVRSATPATASAWDRVIVPIPDGFEIAGNGTIQIGMTANATFVTNAPTWDVTIIGYEY